MSDTDSPAVIGVDIGGSKTIAGLVTAAGDILRTQQLATSSTPPAVLAAVQRLCQALLDKSDHDVIGIGIGTAGMVNAKVGQVIHANDNLPAWTAARLSAIPIGQQLPIIIENDVRAMSYGEAVLGAGSDYSSLLCVAVGTGIGGGVVVDGKIWRGATYSAGEIGYLVADWQDDKPILLDQFASGPAIARAYCQAIQSDERLPLIAVSQRAQAGDKTAVAVIRQKARQLGFILGGYVTSLNPQAVVIGGGVTQIGALWWDALETAFRQALPPPLKSTPLLPSSLGIEAVLLGAAMLAWQKLRLDACTDH